jgi:hypothetical protein
MALIFCWLLTVSLSLFFFSPTNEKKMNVAVLKKEMKEMWEIDFIILEKPTATRRLDPEPKEREGKVLRVLPSGRWLPHNQG